MNELASLLNAVIEAHPRSRLRELEWEALPNEVRNLPRLQPWRGARAPITRVTNIRPITRDEWRAWGL